MVSLADTDEDVKSHEIQQLWNDLPTRRSVAGRRWPDVIRGSEGRSGHAWIDQQARRGFDIAVALRDEHDVVQSLMLCYGGEEPPIWYGKPMKALTLKGYPTRGLAIFDPELDTPGMTVTIVDGPEEWIAGPHFNSWVLGLPGKGCLSSVLDAFAGRFWTRTPHTGNLGR